MLARRAMTDLLARSSAVPNPFGYPRQRVQPRGGDPRDAFFFPHENDSGYWWQGENATLGSLAFAALLVAESPETPPAFEAARLESFAADQLSWILGRNPFDACMLQGRGRNNIEYSPPTIRTCRAASSTASRAPSTTSTTSPSSSPRRQTDQTRGVGRSSGFRTRRGSCSRRRHSRRRPRERDRARGLREVVAQNPLR